MQPRYTFLLAAIAAIAAATAYGHAWGAPPQLELPIRCEMGRDCYIQNYFDHDPGPGWRDYACGRLSYDGHHGTDLRLLDIPQMMCGVAVVAAADGRVVAIRDGEPDISVKRRGKAALQGRDAGNGVRIDHGDGWVTQYNHMRRGSVRVQPGEHVHAGETLGLVGLSGNTEFPHLDLDVSKDGVPVDPFSPRGGGECGAPMSALWSANAMAALRYRATGLLISGFSSTAPTREDAEAGKYGSTNLTVKSDAIAFWVEGFGLRTGDRQSWVFKGPGGEILVRSDSEAPGDKAVWFSFAGKRRSRADWPPGRYSARYTLERSGERVIDKTRDVLIR